MEIVPGVHAIEGLKTGRVYLYREADRLTLIDTGQPGSAARILSEVERLGRRPQDLRQVVITHCHQDHTGSLAELVERTGAQVLVHAEDAPVVRGEAVAPPARMSGVELVLFRLIAQRIPPAGPACVDRELSDGDEVDLDGGARVVHVPGHTPGSIALYVPGRKLLFTGDAVARGLLGGAAQGVFNVSPRQARESLRKLAELDVEVACFGHGRPLDRDAARALRRLAERVGEGRAG